MNALLELARVEFDYVIVDLPKCARNWTETVLSHSDLMYLVAQPTLPTASRLRSGAPGRSGARRKRRSAAVRYCIADQPDVLLDAAHRRHAGTRRASPQPLRPRAAPLLDRSLRELAARPPLPAPTASWSPHRPADLRGWGERPHRTRGEPVLFPKFDPRADLRLSRFSRACSHAVSATDAAAFGAGSGNHLGQELHGHAARRRQSARYDTLGLPGRTWPTVAANAGILLSRLAELRQKAMISWVGGRRRLAATRQAARAGWRLLCEVRHRCRHGGSVRRSRRDTPGRRADPGPRDRRPGRAEGGWDQTGRAMQSALQEAGLASGIQVANIPAPAAPALASPSSSRVRRARATR